MTKDKKQFEDTGDKAYLKKAIEGMEEARSTLKVVHERSINGDKNPVWKGWYHPENRRPNNGFPSFEMMDAIEANLQSKI